MKLKSYLMMLVAAVAASVEAAPLAGQAGSDTVARAQAPEKVVDQKSVPTAEAPKPDVPKANPKDAIAIGVIDRVTLVGHEDFIREQEVESLLAPAICDGQVKTVGDIKQAMAEAKAVLVRRGFYLVYINVARGDAYDAVARTLELRVEPGRFGKVSIDHDENAGNWYADEQLMKRFKYVKEGEPFNYHTLRQAFRAINGHPDLVGNMNVEIRNAATNGIESAGLRYLDAELTVDDSFPLHATLDINNYAMEELGYWQALLAVQYLNVSGADDVLTVSPGVTFDGSMWSLAASYLRPFDILRGGSWSVYGGYSDLDSDEVIDRTDLVGIGGFAGLNTTWNLYDTEARNVAFTLGVMWRYLKDQWTVSGMDLQQRDINVVPLTAGFSYADKRRDWLGGLDFASWTETVNLCADREKMRAYSEDADGNYTIMRANWMRLQPLYGPNVDGEEWRCWNLFTRIEGQWSQGNTLISAERLAYGGNACLRGYRTRGYLGDSGLYGTAEFRTPVWANPVSDLLVDDLKMAIERIQLFVFSDMGGLWYNESYTGMDQDEFLWSAGFGCRMALTKYLSLNFDFAVPLVEAYADEKDKNCEVYIGVKAQY